MTPTPSAARRRTTPKSVSTWGVVEDRGRLVHDQQLHPAAERAGDRHDLLRRWAQRADVHVGNDVAVAEAVEQRCRLGAHARAVEQAEAARLVAEEDRLGHPQVLDQVEFLIDRPDPSGHGLRRLAHGKQLAFDADLTLGRGDHAEALLAHQLVYEAGGSASTGGRPPTVLAFNRGAGVVLVADLGATHSRLAVSDLGGTPLAERAYHTHVARDPEVVLSWVHERFLELLAVVERDREDVRGIGLGVPAPVAFSRGEPVAPPMMPGWDGFSIPDWFARYYNA